MLGNITDRLYQGEEGDVDPQNQVDSLQGTRLEVTRLGVSQLP